MKANIQDIIQHAKENKIESELLVVPPLSVGEFVAQGDLNLICIPCVPDNAVLVTNPEKQLVPGNSMGSRHCLSSLDNVKIYRLDNPNSLQHCIIEFLGGETILEHPEHKNQLWNQSIIVLVASQRDRGEEIKAISD